MADFRLHNIASLAVGTLYSVTSQTTYRDRRYTAYYSTGIIEKLPVYCKVGFTHYLPHRPIIREDKLASKTRIVLMLAFRTNNIAIIADMEKAFLQICLHEGHRKYVRFLWYENIEQINFLDFEENKLIKYRLCRILFGLTSSPFIFSAVLQKHINTNQDVDKNLEKLLTSLHVDDLNSGT
ncbi:uncharacterized protein LOC130657822 [Hydractinia symbiolongicarpus]|uniref:uncharacterized protein LOC130657822 n=1 Tax=Hydractinia symbiolongicarpus TaxID=13093 RepID=UPI00254B98EB|nr:uncharacterized protein LOC130657822 [Hydractinia symbiolongicarpus]